jgi:hypothetical protein
VAWARLDDGFYDHPKITRVWRRCPGAVGLHARVIAYCARHETDGHILAEIVTGLSPLQRDREAQVKALIEEGLWYQGEDGFVIHDYLDYNPSREQINHKRAEDRERKRDQRAKRNA